MGARLQDRRADDLVHFLRRHWELLPHSSCIDLKGRFLGDIHALDEADCLSNNLIDLGCRYLDWTNRRNAEYIFQNLDNWGCRLSVQDDINPPVFLLDFGRRVSLQQILNMS